MKIDRTGIVALIAAVVLGLVVLGGLGFNITAILFLTIPLALIIYLIILTRRYVDAKVQELKISSDIAAKITLLNESLERMEKKIDKALEK